jgi:aspartate ammonia-lyase
LFNKNICFVDYIAKGVGSFFMSFYLERYYMKNQILFAGNESLKSFRNFALNEERTSLKLIHAMITVKKACALSNYDAGLLEEKKCQMIVLACQRIQQILEKNEECSSLDDDELLILNSFATHPLQGGAGTSTNINVNEVICRVALHMNGYDVDNYEILHPINHVNMSQSTNDVYPSALKIASIFEVRLLADQLAQLQESLQTKENQYADTLKLGRTQLMDALPVTMGQTFGAFARAISRDRWRIYKVEERLREINMGGTAVGTGMNAPLMYIYGVTEKLQQLTGLGIARSDLLIDSTQNLDVFVEVSGLLKALATNLLKISNDLRLMNSGPIAGLGEITLEAHQAGSTIMPGKVNPVICEMVNQIAFRVIGADTAITMAASSGQLELNPYGPLIAQELLTSLILLREGIQLFRVKCIETLTVNETHCREQALSSLGIAAAFIDSLGYDQASHIANQALKRKQTIKETLLQEQLLDESTIDSILNTHQLTQPGIPGKR